MPISSSPSLSNITRVNGTDLDFAREDAAGDFRTLAQWLTVECVLIVALSLLAVITRFWTLGDWPLQSAEARNALQSWEIARGHGGSVEAGPLLAYGNALLFFAFGVNDATPRLLPALSGIALALLPLLLRRQLGRGAMLVSSGLLLFSPTVMYLARVAESTIVLSAASLAAVIFLHKAMSSRSRRTPHVAGAALCVVALAGPGFYVVLLVLLGAAVFWRCKVADLKRRAGNIALITFGIVILGATGLLTNLHGIQEGLVGPFDQLMHISYRSGDVLRPLTALLFYEPLALIFGAVGSFLGLRHRHAWTYFLTWWALAALLAASASGQPSGIVLALPPLALLAGRGIACVIVGLRDQVGKGDLIVYLGTNLSLLVLFWISSQFFSLPGASLPAGVQVGGANVAMQSLAEIILRAEIVLIFGAVVGLAYWLSTSKMASLIAVIALTVLGLTTVRSGMQLAYNGSPAELLVASRTSVDARVMAREIGDAVDSLKVIETGSSLRNRGHAVRVTVAEEADVVRWYLRDLPDVEYGQGAANEAIVVAPAEADPPAGTFATQRFQLQTHWKGEGDAGRLWRWATLRETSALQSKDVVVYIRLPGQ